MGRPQKGYLCKLYYNSGTWASPTWVEIPIITDVDLPDSKREADVTSRASGGVARFMGGLREMGVTTDLRWKSGNSALEYIRDAYLNGEAIDVVALDGPVATVGSQGPRFIGEVMQFNRKEPLSDGVIVSIVIKPTDSDEAVSVAWMEVEA